MAITIDSSSKISRDKIAGTAGRRKTTQRKKRNSAGRPTAEELERRKRRVMEVATDLFVQHGYAATTLLDIAKVAGVATRTLYQHFGDKEDIFREVIFARDTAIINPPVLEPGDDVMAALRKAAHYSYEVSLRTRSIELMRLMIAESARFPDLMSKIANTIFARFTGNLAHLFRQLSDAGLIPAGDHDQSARLFADLIMGNQTIMTYFGWLTGAPTAEDIEVKIDLFVNGRFGAPARALGKANKSGASPKERPKAARRS